MHHNVDNFITLFVNSMSKQNFLVKKISYLIVSIILEQESSFKIMIVSTVIKDLRLNCNFTQLIALTVVEKLVNQTTAEAFYETIRELTQSHNSLVRKKSYMVLIEMTIKYKGQQDASEYVIMALRDQEPIVYLSVLSYSFNLL